MNAEVLRSINGGGKQTQRKELTRPNVKCRPPGRGYLAIGMSLEWRNQKRGMYVQWDRSPP